MEMVVGRMVVQRTAKGGGHGTTGVNWTFVGRDGIGVGIGVGGTGGMRGGMRGGLQGQMQQRCGGGQRRMQRFNTGTLH